MTYGLNLPEYPWEALAPYRGNRGRPPGRPGGPVHRHPGRPTPQNIREALAAASDAPGYPTTHGTPALREAIAEWFERRRGVKGLSPDAIMPTVGSKELVAWLPFLLGLGPGDVGRCTRACVPTYDTGCPLCPRRVCARRQPGRAGR